NSSGRISVVAVVSGNSVNELNELGLWSNGMSSDGDLKLVARQGNHAPGSNRDFVFGTFLEPSINAAGQTVFMALGYQLDNGSVIDSAFGIWGENRAGVLTLVARAGQEVTLDTNDHRTIASLSFASNSGGEDGHGSGLNDLGQVVFHATFTDGSSGIVISDALTVPEASTIALLTFAAGCFASINQLRHRENR
ncbi:MAG TPA: choice-of-anchor tandem repeat NxxGxxAF-containing protein, partial [Pirellula sp.]|nr:choice-of-anchor tandem repeat NxxGxxAF-containing protein [Pirellula sp.]